MLALYNEEESLFLIDNILIKEGIKIKAKGYNNKNKNENNVSSINIIYVFL